MKRVLHVSPTDIRYDSRILKELKAINEIDNIYLKAFGVEDNEGHKYEIEVPSYLVIFQLLSKRLRFLPRPIRYFLNLLEATLKLTIPGVRFKPDIIHCHDTLYLPIAIMIKFFCKSKLIYDAHELESDKAGQSKILSRYTLFIEKIAWKHIDLLITVSSSIIEWYKLNLGEKPSLLILNSPTQELDIEDVYGSEKNYLREKFSIPNEAKIYLYLGILSKKGRGIEYYLDIFREDGIMGHLVLIGYGQDAEEIKRISEAHPKIHYHAAVRHDQVVEISKCADVGLCLIEAVSLSDYYCLPNKLFEYAFSGLYILGSDFPDIRKVVQEYDLGRCSALNNDDLVAAVKEIDIMTIQKSKKNLYKLSWSYQAEQLKSNYELILKR